MAPAQIVTAAQPKVELPFTVVKEGAVRGGREDHWDSAYRDRGTAGVSWFQPEPTMSIELIRSLGFPRDAAIIDVGGGTSFLVDALLDDGFDDLSVLDVSDVALQAVRQRLSSDAPVTLIHDDVLAWRPERAFDLWHDRALFHFLVDEATRTEYLNTLHRALLAGGFVILGTFASDGPEYCSGLPVARYSAEDLTRVMGTDFEILGRTREEHLTPAAAIQPFTWLTARRR